MHVIVTSHEESHFTTLSGKFEPDQPSPSQRMTGAQAVIESLLAEDVDLLFGYPGGAIMPVYDALFDYQKQLRHILVRHEQGATHAAQGYARASGKTGVCLVTSGPGATNLVTGLADANIDSTPLVCITGQVASPLLGTDAFQETDVIGISMPATKWNYQIARAEEIPEIFAKAFYIARSGRPGPVVIDITKDAQLNSLDFSYRPCYSVRSYIPKPVPNREKLVAAAALINAAERPYVLFGQGIILGQAENEFRQFIEKSGIPAAATLLGLSALPSDHPLHVGMLGMHGNYAPNLLTNQCDVLLAIGMRFDDRVTGDLKRYAKQARIIHLDIDAAEIDKNVKVEIAIHADAKEALPMLTQLVQQRDHSAWHAEFRKYTALEYEKVIENELYPTKPGLTMGEVIRTISEKTLGEAVVVSDVGQHQMVAARYSRFKQSRSHITSGGLGTMGFCLPAAIGAKLGAPHREVIGIIGDGGFQMTLQELGVILQSEVPVKIVILNNNYLGMVRQWQQLFFGKRYSFTHMVNPDFVAIARGYSVQAEKVQERSQLEPAVEKMLAHDGAFLLEVVVEKEDNVFPMVPAGKSVAEVRLE